MKTIQLTNEIKTKEFNFFKKQIITVLSLVGLSTSLVAQLPASTIPQNKKVVIEEFTGIHCGFCPDGHKTSEQIYTADPSNVIVINIHGGTLANPNIAGDVDLRTTEGSAIENNLNFNSGSSSWSYPSASFNRSAMTFTCIPNPLRSSWAGDAANIKSQSAYCNVAVQGSVNINTRVLTVQAQVYYTGTSPNSTNFLSVMLLESVIAGKQSDYGNFNPTNWNSDGTYKHNHALRKVITSTYGDAINATTAGSIYNTTLTYTIPVKYGNTPYDNACLLQRLELVAFVTEKTQTLTVNGCRGPIALTGFANALDIATGSASYDAAVCAGKLNSAFTFTNNGGTTINSAVFTYSVNGTAIGTYSWTGSVNPLYQSGVITLPTANFTPLSINTLNIDVVSVNGTNDQNAINNPINANIPLTNVIANNANMQMVFSQDQWGSQTQWTIYNEANGSVIATDGPFPDLSTATTSFHIKSFNVAANTCYKLVVTDAGNNGINSGSGNGFYQIKSGYAIYNSTGIFGSVENVWFKTPTILGIFADVLNITNLNLYPNPTNGDANLNIEAAENEKVTVTVMNNLGQLVYSESLVLEAGNNTVKFNTADWAASIYHVKVITTRGSVTQKLTVTK